MQQQKGNPSTGSRSRCDIQKKLGIMRLSSPSMWFRKRPRRFSGNRLAVHRSPPVMRGQGPPIKPRTTRHARRRPHPQKHCPFCQGFAAFQFAIAPAHTISIVRVAIKAPAPHLTSEGLAGVSLRAPQSRGPPTIPA